MQTLGRYEIRGELGRGGMGVVYRAYDPTLDREVAIKSVRLEGIDEAAIARLEERLSREAKAAAKLQHPNIVAVYDFFRLDDRAYIVMEFVRGSMLDAMVLGDTRPPNTRIIEILQQAASALDAAHANGIVHRDIKPGNMLLDESGRLKVTDFGIARITSAGSTQTISEGLGSTVGTLGYMAPEQIRGEAVDGRADQFSLGIVAYQLFTGQMPFVADTWIALSYQIIHATHAPAMSHNKSVTPAIDAAIARAIAKEPAKRFPTCLAFVEALASATAVSSGAKKSTRTPLAIAAMIGIATALVWIMLRPSNISQPSIPVPTSTAQAPPAVTPPPIEFAAIPSGRFFMGSDTDGDDQRPRHLVVLTKPFEMARTETTEAQWNEVMTGKKSGADLPKNSVSWNDAQAFIAKLNQRGDGFLYRLPTEAEWEYAAKANAPDARQPEDIAWFHNNAGRQRHEVATLTANAFGLYDMLGNINEWTGDWVSLEYYGQSPRNDPQGPKTGTAKISRGGNYSTPGMSLSTTWRFGDEPAFRHEGTGFRVVRVRR